MVLGAVTLIGAALLGVRAFQLATEPASLPTEILDVERRLDPSRSVTDDQAHREPGDPPSAPEASPSPSPEQPEVAEQTPAEQSQIPQPAPQWDDDDWDDDDWDDDDWDDDWDDDDWDDDDDD
ncbi:hypothetical protein GCM10009674_10000 [Nesterenkonia xinjiangensis]